MLDGFLHVIFLQSAANQAMVASIYQQELAKMANHSQKESPMSLKTSSRCHSGSEIEKTETRGRRALCDSNISSDIVTKIYQEELAKLAQAAQASGNIAESTMYQQELHRLAQNAKRQNGEQKENGELENDENRVRVKMEPPGTPDQERSSSVDSAVFNGSVQEHMRHAGSAFFLVRPRSNGQPTPSEMFPYVNPESMSPLQRMQSIANSVLGKSQSPVPHKPLKAVLPPISQEQFDKYANLDTDALVKKVKDTLSQYSISQRLFGEHILGLSQGSVSDLLARPKPWHMLTQKGREPFIRMQIFLEDTEAIPKLVSSQYRIPPDKLMRSGQYANNPAGMPQQSSPQGKIYFCMLLLPTQHLEKTTPIFL